MQSIIPFILPFLPYWLLIPFSLLCYPLLAILDFLSSLSIPHSLSSFPHITLSFACYFPLLSFIISTSFLLCSITLPSFYSPFHCNPFNFLIYRFASHFSSPNIIFTLPSTPHTTFLWPSSLFPLFSICLIFFFTFPSTFLSSYHISFSYPLISSTSLSSILLLSFHPIIPSHAPHLP